MIPHIPDQRKVPSNKSKPFDSLVSYISKISKDKELEVGQGRAIETQPIAKKQDNAFSDLVNYAIDANSVDLKADKCLAIRTNGISDLSTASAEMNAVAARNTRCKNPAHHIILSWPEHEKPDHNDIFDAAEHALKALGLSEHQYVLAIHGNTDNIHCHISVNRVNPKTFKSKNLEWQLKTLHFAARESEIKHNWTNDNGIYIVEKDARGKKKIVLNPEHANAVTQPHVHREMGNEIQPPWHDPDSLETWLRKKIANELKKNLDKLKSWDELHAWLDQYGIALINTGGGGLRLKVLSEETGEIVEMAASKGLRNIKRPELENKWGPFTDPLHLPCKVPDLSHLTPNQLQKGINNVITRDQLDGKPPQHVLDRNNATERRPDGSRNDFLRDQQLATGDETEGTSGVHELPASGVDARRQGADVLLQNTLQNGLGDLRARQHQDMRRTGASETGGRSKRSLARDDSKRQERKEERAKNRIDLKNRFAQYKSYVRDSDTNTYLNLKQLKLDRSKLLKELREYRYQELKSIPKGLDEGARLTIVVALNATILREKLEIEAAYQRQLKEIKAVQTPPLNWRMWLLEQAKLGDQAALSALRGIVYQAQRDAKKRDVPDETATVTEHETDEQKFKKLMKRLLEEEKRETAIRAASMVQMRPYEADALLHHYNDLHWEISGNGNVEYRNGHGDQIFTDRGNRLTFDKDLVTDDEIRLALAHAQQKFGHGITLTGDDPEFVARMARLADDMNLVVLNPEMQTVIALHRESRQAQEHDTITIKPVELDDIELNSQVQPNCDLTHQTEKYDRLKAQILEIDPSATFVIAAQISTPANYQGRISATTPGGFAQHIGKGVHVLYDLDRPEIKRNSTITTTIANNGINIAIENQKTDQTKER
jgi:hypothetical protein